ncbi:hypothetical protein B4110_1562 [Parageobacillus toebii]|uniref:Uncharacterized protein n=1 Tax=Parageobacillus toebii TaxID=153151 RepID=A0A150MK93_9BACL|nr:hypothetical protein B4110_1562 [Parageobacillus toebii]
MVVVHKWFLLISCFLNIYHKKTILSFDKIVFQQSDLNGYE